MKQNLPTWGVEVRMYQDHITCTNYLRNDQVPPINAGPRASVGLTQKAAGRIRRGVAYLEAQGPTWFVTLTYPNTSPNGELAKPGDLINVVEDKEAKRHLSMWLRRVKRVYSDFRYVWVAEVQPERLEQRAERAIHFHLVTNCKLPNAWLNESWTEVVGRGPAYPNQQKVKRSAGAYLAKYLTKSRKVSDMTPMEVLKAYIEGNRYGMDQRVNANLKLVSWAAFPGGDWFQVAQHLIPADVPFSLKSDANYLGIWYGFSYLYGNGNTRNNTRVRSNIPDIGGPVHRCTREVDFAGRQRPGLPGRKSGRTDAVPDDDSQGGDESTS